MLSKCDLFFNSLSNIPFISKSVSILSSIGLSGSPIIYNIFYRRSYKPNQPSNLLQGFKYAHLCSKFVIINIITFSKIIYGPLRSWSKYNRRTELTHSHKLLGVTLLVESYNVGRIYTERSYEFTAIISSKSLRNLLSSL